MKYISDAIGLIVKTSGEALAKAVVKRTGRYPVLTSDSERVNIVEDLFYDFDFFSVLENFVDAKRLQKFTNNVDREMKNAEVSESGKQ